MDNKSICFIEDLSRTDVELLTQLLSLQFFCPRPSWLDDQARSIASFPPTLLAPSAFIPRLVMRLPFTPPRAILCQTHKPLNSHLIHRIFMQITAECTTRVRYLAQSEGLTPKVRAWVRRLQSINSLSMAPEIYRAAFQAQPWDTRFERIKSGCEACILARVGGSKQCLADLRSSALGRRRKSRPAPRILQLLEGWIGWTGEGDVIRNESNLMAKKIRKARREIYAARRGNAIRSKSDEGLEKVQAVWVEIDEPEEHARECEGLGEEEADFEGSIISFYQNLVSTTDLSQDSYMDHPFAMRSEREGMIHPAFHRTSRLAPEPGEYYSESKARPLPTSLKRKRAYSESIYSVGSGFGGSDTMYTGQQSTTSYHETLGSAEEHARAYRKLIGVPSDPAEAHEDRSKKTSRTYTRYSRNPLTDLLEDEEEYDKESRCESDRMTKWSNLYRK